jgi:hypothetical protein
VPSDAPAWSFAGAVASLTGVAGTLLIDRDNDFSTGMLFARIAESFRGFPKRVASIDHWRHFAGFHQLYK